MMRTTSRPSCRVTTTAWSGSRNRLRACSAHDSAGGSIRSTHWTRMKKRIMLALVGATAGTTAAQAAGGQVRTTVSGIVFDSLVSNAPLAGAEVTIDGT